MGENGSLNVWGVNATSRPSTTHAATQAPTVSAH